LKEGETRRTALVPETAEVVASLKGHVTVTTFAALMAMLYFVCSAGRHPLDQMDEHSAGADDVKLVRAADRREEFEAKVDVFCARLHKDVK
jgi:heme oxygenase